VVIYANSDEDVLLNKLLWNEEFLYPENLAPRAADVKVLACTGSNIRAPSAALEGTLSGVASFSKRLGLRFEYEYLNYS